jgi:hypothetical protein
MSTPSIDAIDGACLCDAVAYAADGPFPIFQYCHCSRCRRFTGSAHGANVFCPPGQFRWIRGEDAVQRFALPGARHFATAFCRTCGSSLPWLNQSGTMVIIPAGTVNGDVPLKPQGNIMWSSRAPWYVHASELETHDEMPPRRR